MVKRAFFVILAVLLILPSIVVSATSEALYSGTVRVSNSSYTAQHVSVPFYLNSTALIDGNYIRNDYGNVTMVDGDGGIVPFMPAPPGSTSWALFTPQISQNTSQNYSLYTGGPDMDQKIVYLPGDAGMTTEDNPSMDLSGDFEIIIDGYIDTSAGANKKILSKDGSLELYVSGEGEITLLTDLDPPFPVFKGRTGNWVQAYNITVQIPPQTIAGDLLVLCRTGYAGDSALDIPAGWTLLSSDNSENNYQTIVYKIAQGNETSFTWGAGTRGSYVCYCISGSDEVVAGIPSRAVNNTRPDPPPLTVEGPYSKILWIVFASRTNEPTGYPANYSEGITYINSAGSTATALRFLDSLSEDPSYFQYPGVSTSVANTLAVIPSGRALGLTASNVQPGEHEIKIASSGGTVYLYVDGQLKDSASLGGDIFQASTDWEYCLNGSVSYLNSLKTYVSGNLVQHIEWQPGLIFSDLSGVGNDATPAFRTASTAPAVTAHMLGFSPSFPSQFPMPTQAVQPPLTGLPAESDTMYGSVDVNLPGADVVNELLDQGRVPRDLFWYPVLFGLAIILGMFAFHLTRSVMFQAIISGVAVAVATAGILQADWWVIIPYILISIALITQRKTVSL